MDSSVISDHLEEWLDDCEVIAAVFTSYTFEPDFFELEVIPLILPESIPYSTDSRVKEFQVREALRESDLKFEVFYDLPIFRKEGDRSPNMEYLCHGVQRGNNAFHAKLVLLLAYDDKSESECLVVGAGSNNLTRAGWWDNIECQHWEVVWPGEAPRRFLNRLRDDISYLQSERLLDAGEQNSALDQINIFLETCRAGNAAEPIAYYGIRSSHQRQNFHQFLRKQRDSLAQYSNWTVEIISPFFAEDTENREHEFFFDLGAQAIHILLPQDQEGNALCEEAYLDHIEAQEDVHWAEWHPTTRRNLGMSGERFRRLHAKVYHFYNRKQSWAFVGSVNFSHRAMRENAEAGFFVKFDSAGPLLKPISDTTAGKHCLPPNEGFPGKPVEPDQPPALPLIQLAYDWVEGQLSGATAPGESYEINILNAEGNPVVNDFTLTDEEITYSGSTQKLEALLKNGSLVKVTGTDISSETPFPPHIIMLQQTGWTHKPLELPDLTAEQILAIYADMNPERRQLLLMNAKIRQLVLQGEAGEITFSEDEIAVDEFFSEYAEIFHAFRRLRQHMDNALEAENEALIDYYLTGRGMDSLPTLLEHLEDDENASRSVTAYLLLLCAREIYQAAPFKRRRGVANLLRRLKGDIAHLKRSSRIKLEDNLPANRKRFFEWFEGQFFKQYRTREAAK